MSRSFNDQSNTDVSPPKQPLVEETATVEVAPAVESSVDLEELLHLDEEERQRRLEAEKREKDGLNATIDSIFTLPDDEEVSRSPIRKS